MEGEGYEVVDSVFDFEDIEGIKNKPLYYLAKSIELIASKVDLIYISKRMGIRKRSFHRV